MPVAPHSHWRDLKQWSDYGLQFSTASDQAVKLWDATVTQYVGWYNDDSVGGIEKSSADMINADPNFAMGRVLSAGLDLMGTARNIRTDPTFRHEIEQLDKMNVNQWEKQHVEAIKLWSNGQCRKAALVWENILVDHPKDILALKFAEDHYFYYGQQVEMRDSIARVLPHWNREDPLYSYLLGMLSFGLVETNLFQEAEAVSKKGLEINSLDAWSTHSLAHVYEMTGRPKEGIAFLSQTMNDWTKCGALACHNYWHWAIYHVERNEHQAAVDIFENEISRRAKDGAWLNLVDACSILYRLELEGIKVGEERWERIYELCRPHLDEHVTVFNDVHILMSCLGCKKPELTVNLLKSMEKYIAEFSEQEEMAKIGKDVGQALCSAFIAYDSGEYDSAVETLLPIKYKIINIGGSNAQRDVFSLLLVNAALKSKNHKKLCRNLIYERKALKKDSPMNERLMDRLLLAHDH